MSAHIPDRLRRRVRRRAGERCEYCGLSQAGQEATFHVDHVVPLKEGGATSFDNLALSCVSCSLRKAARLHAVDPETGRQVMLFDPRREAWHEHFQWEDFRLVGKTPTGRATIDALAMNRPLILAIRREEAALSRPPPV